MRIFFLNLILFSSLQLIFSQEIQEIKIITPDYLKSGEEYVIENVIKKGNTSGFARLQNYLPAGYEASAVETHGGSFSFDSNTNLVKIIWLSLPAASEFTVKYKVVVPESTSSSDNIRGDMAYVDGTERKEYAIESKFLNYSAPVAKAEEPKVEKTTSTTSTSSYTSPTSYNTSSSYYSPSSYTPSSSSYTSSKSSTYYDGASFYRVQVAALSQYKSVDYIKRSLGISETVYTGTYNGLYIYSVGKFKSRESAINYMSQLQSKGVYDAFVTSHDASGKRIAP